MTIFIHGFASSGQGTKANLFREYFKSIDKPYIAPSLSYVPQLAITTLEELIDSYDKVNLIGSSLGGYYAIYLSEKYELKTVLINPAIKSAKTLRKMISLKGYVPNFYDNSSFKWQESHLEMLEKYNTEVIKSHKHLLLLKKGDDLLDYRDAVAKMPNASMIIEEEGSHQFEDIDKHLQTIIKFLY